MWPLHDDEKHHVFSLPSKTRIHIVVDDYDETMPAHVGVHAPSSVHG